MSNFNSFEALGAFFNISLEVENQEVIPSNTKSYHKEIGFPKKLYIQERFIRPKYTPHAIEASKTDRYGVITLPSSFMMKREDVIELEMVDNKLNKLVIRRPYNEKYDLIIVFLVQGNKVKTVWLNDKNDAHTTLDESKYCKDL